MLRSILFSLIYIYAHLFELFLFYFERKLFIADFQCKTLIKIHVFIKKNFNVWEREICYMCSYSSISKWFSVLFMKIFRVLQFSSIFCSWQFFLLLVQIILTSSVTNVSNFEYAKKLVQNEWYTHSRTCVLHSVVLTFKLCLVQNTCISIVHFI